MAGQAGMLQRALPGGLGGEFVRVTSRKPARFSSLSPSSTSGWAGMVSKPSLSASTSATSTAIPWTVPTISKTPRPSEKKSS